MLVLKLLQSTKLTHVFLFFSFFHHDVFVSSVLLFFQFFFKLLIFTQKIEEPLSARVQKLIHIMVLHNIFGEPDHDIFLQL